MPPVEIWQEQQQQALESWGDEEQRLSAFSSREDLQWCKSASDTVRHYNLNGWVVLARLTDFEDRLTRVVVGRNAQGELDLQPSIVISAEGGYNSTIVAEIRAPSKRACCSYSTATSYEGIGVLDEILTVNGVQVSRQGPGALQYALWRADALIGHSKVDMQSPKRVVYEILKQKVISGKRGDTMKSKVEKALSLVDSSKETLELADAERAMQLIVRAARHVGRSAVPVWMANHTGAVTINEWTAFATSLQSWALRDEKGQPGFRPEIMKLAVQAQAKTLELSLLMSRALTVDGAANGFWDKREQYEELLAGQASGNRLTVQFSKLMQSLVWLNRTAAACALGELAVSEAVFSHVDQAPTHFTRDVDTVRWVPREAIASYANYLESNFADIQKEYQYAREVSAQNPLASIFFKPPEAPIADLHDDVQELELFRRGYELKNCAVFPRTCEVMRQLPEASKFAGTIRFFTIAPGAAVKSHFALANDHLRLQLGVDVPEPEAVELQVGGEQRRWEQGKVVAIDDSFVHSVHNRGQISQTVLVVDVLHPNHPDPSEMLRDTITESELDEIEARQQDWVAHFE